MSSDLVEIVLNRQKQIRSDHLNYDKVEHWVTDLFQFVFPSSSKSKNIETPEKIKEQLQEQIKQLSELLFKNFSHKSKEQAENLSNSFYQELSHLLKEFEADLQGYFGEHQLSSQEIKKQYPQFMAIFKYRVGHWFYQKGEKTFAKTIKKILNLGNVNIHQSCRIGSGLILRSNYNITIAEGVIIGKNVSIYGGVTIESTNKSNQYLIIQDEVTIHSNSTIIGQDLIIGKGSMIGNNSIVTESTLPNSKILLNPSFQLSPKNIKDLNSIQSLIGNTPLVEIKSIFKNPKVKIFAKLEGQNPGGSVKDRPAYNMIKQALKRGDIKPGMKLIQPTSGNTGIALAMIACVFNLDIELVMPENSTAERVQTMEAYGAKVILTPAKTGIEGSRDYAEAKVAEGGYKMLNQFANPDNYMAHYYSTGPEIWRDTKGGITHFVSSMGTTGTIMGTSMYLKQKKQEIRIVGVQPKDGAKIPGIRRWTPEYLPKIFNRERVDSIIDVSQQESLEMMRRIAQQQAIFAGMSSGGAMAAAVRLASTLESGVIVTIVCDRGDRYLSSGIFAKDYKP